MQYNYSWIACSLLLVLTGFVKVRSAPLNGGIGGSDSGGGGGVRVRRSLGGAEGGFSLHREGGAGLHSEGPELEEAAAVAVEGNATAAVSGAGRSRRASSADLEQFIEEMADKRINVSVEFPLGSGGNPLAGRERRDAAECNRDKDGRVVCSAGGFRFVLDGGADQLKRVRRFVEEVYGRLDAVDEGSGKVKRESSEEEDEGRSEGEGGGKVEDAKKEAAFAEVAKRESCSSTQAGLGDDAGGSPAGGSCGGGCNTPECPTFRVYPPYFSTPCCRTTQSCPTKPCPVKPRPVMFITAPPPRVCPCPTVCCLGEPTCVCQSTTCPTPCSSTCHEHTCPLAGQARSKPKLNPSRLKLKAMSQVVGAHQASNHGDDAASLKEESKPNLKEEETAKCAAEVKAEAAEVAEAGNGKADESGDESVAAVNEKSVDVSESREEKGEAREEGEQAEEESKGEEAVAAAAEKSTGAEEESAAAFESGEGNDTEGEVPRADQRGGDSDLAPQQEE